MELIFDLIMNNPSIAKIQLKLQMMVLIFCVNDEHPLKLPFFKIKKKRIIIVINSIQKIVNFQTMLRKLVGDENIFSNSNYMENALMAIKFTDKKYTAHAAENLKKYFQLKTLLSKA